MKNTLLFIFLFSFFNTNSQKIKALVLDFKSKTPIEKAHVFLPNKIVYSNKKGEFRLDLNQKKSINFSISHVQYTTQNFTYKKTDTLAVYYLYEKQETLEGIELNSKNNLQKNLKFKKLNNLPVGTYSFASVLRNGNIYAFGGDASSEIEKNKEGLSSIQFSNEFEIMRFLRQPKPISFNTYKSDIQKYNIEKGVWFHSDEKIAKRAYHKAVFYQDEVYLIGGKKLSKKKTRELLVDEIEIVSLKDYSIKKDRTNPHQSVDFDAELYEDKIVVFGGSIKQTKNGNKRFSDEVHFYDLKSGYWYLLTKMSKGKEVSGIVFGDKLYLFGGFNKKHLTEIESFNFKTGRWKKEGTLFNGMKKPAITKDKEFIYLQENGKIITFQPQKKELKEYSIDLNLKSSEMHFYNEILYILGGYQVEDYRKLPSNGFYSVNTLEFFKTKPINSKTLN